MHRKPWWIGILLGAAVLLLCPAAGADESDPLPAPKGTPRGRAVGLYNEGVALLRDKALAEAHNNLAFSLRTQGMHHAERALRHYNRALELKPDLAQAYMYRGVLFVRMGDLSRARADHAKLLVLDRGLAVELERVIGGASDRDGAAGVASPYD
jgi:tetratricopeptide (TPR) repeat protein